MSGANATHFEVLPWEIEGNCVTLHFQSSVGHFSEVIHFPVEIAVTEQRRHLLDMLALVAAVSYAKVLAPTSIDAQHFSVTNETAAMINAVYDLGMREFAFHNNLALQKTFILAAHGTAISQSSPPSRIDDSSSLLIPFGAGRDSSVVATALQPLQPLLVTIGENSYAQKIADRLSLSLHTITRTIDPHLLELNAHGARNGHIPVTAINSIISLLHADIMRCVGVVMANELSSSEPTRHVDSVEVNHQYSKSIHFETLLRGALASSGIALNYFSALRDKTDDAIAQTFALRCTSLHTAFMSCNKAMLRDTTRRSNGWCGNCPKCRSVFLSMAPFVTPQRMTEIFGTNLLDDPDQLSGFGELIDTQNKPFECVGEVATAIDSLHTLKVLPEWASCFVVHSLVAPATIEVPPVSTAKHFIPDAIYRRLNSFFTHETQ